MLDTIVFISINYRLEILIGLAEGYAKSSAATVILMASSSGLMMEATVRCTKLNTKTTTERTCVA